MERQESELLQQKLEEWLGKCGILNRDDEISYASAGPICHSRPITPELCNVDCRRLSGELANGAESTQLSNEFVK